MVFMVFMVLRFMSVISNKFCLLCKVLKTQMKMN